MAARSLPPAARTREALAAARLARSDAVPALILKTVQLESKFKHAKDFGVLTGRGRRGFDEFGSAVKAFVADQTRSIWPARTAESMCLSTTTKRVAWWSCSSGVESSYLAGG